MSRTSEAIHLLKTAQQALDIETRVRDQSASYGQCPANWETPMMKKFKGHIQQARRILQSVETR